MQLRVPAFTALILPRASLTATTGFAVVQTAAFRASCAYIHTRTHREDIIKVVAFDHAGYGQIDNDSNTIAASGICINTR